MSELKNNELSEFGKLIDGTSEEFREHCADKDLGYINSLRNQLAGTFQQLTKMKDDLLRKIKKEKLPKDSEEVKSIQGIYQQLMRVEEKACICVEIAKERQLKD